MESALDYWRARALLDWQIEMGADEAILDAPLDRYTLTDARPAAVPAPGAAPAVAPRPEAPDPVELARAAAAAAPDLEALAAAMDAFEPCELRRGARSTVFAAGRAGARVMLLLDPPRRDEDRAGAPVAGAGAVLLERMLGAIGLSAEAPDLEGAVYMAPVLPWRSPGDHAPDPKDLAMMRPFLERHVELAGPDLLVVMGSVACAALMDGGGLHRLRGRWAELMGRPALPIFPPARLLADPALKREAWADLLTLRARLDRPR
ncbi:uracil-DNA glycosylase [Limimaricola pyoseonensis]|uniref:DNA polymerase n=1 Tax=Limimaricola pyoseonensis TaxID=521013 RepID=A0A1G7JX43_9RHOB|nr:uracil-DNA glycosylase [Limimaricola pyoseonensis]SDF29513.1 DNA polymerase [Limimaricola pyoseonensis]